MNATEVLDLDFKNAFAGNFNFTVGILIRNYYVINSNKDTSEVKIQARIKGSHISNSTEPNSPSSFFGFLSGKSRKNSSSNHQITSLGTSVDQIKEIEEPENL